MEVTAYERKETLLKVADVSLCLGGTQILRNVNVEVHNVVRPGVTQGQVVGLLGPSGMGKTSLFRILAGLDPPDTGSVTVEGKPVHKGMVGVVAQTFPLFAHRTVLSNLKVAGGRQGPSSAAIDRQAADLLKRFGLVDHAAKYPCQLSGGQRQRVAIAQQFMCSEHVLLMDEPFSGLDPLAEEDVCTFIREMAQTDEMKTFVLVTHDVTAALTVADTIWLLGRDRDAQGNIIPGARIQTEIDLAERGLAWHADVTNTPEFVEMRREIRTMFPKL